ncbi:glycosyltransferase [Rhodomicrobium sp. Az07]|uniref:glycosyltransferase family protein n=1 Tax=Rhodomicrobium sp. Az07 TaxID=2839034 RepID=UPI001BE5D173|nr:glycosyltransferase [Rhodomicrobium sp. Az07]MBT3069478.1 glycosyltransferase [Rhodomicrobium sp. Az07]
MKIVFVYWGYENAGSMLDLRGYTRAAKAMGHEAHVYGPRDWASGLDYSKSLSGADAVVFVVEWTTALQFGDNLDWLRLLDSVPRERRLIIDCDGHYNEPIWFMGDYNHRSLQSSAEWIDFCDSLSDKIFQPTCRPRRKNVRPFLFHIYDPGWESPIATGRKKPFDMIYVGHTKHRWRGMFKVFKAIEKVRDKVGRVGLVGEGWGDVIDWMEQGEAKAKHYVDRAYMQAHRFEGLPAVPFNEVAATIEKGVFNPVVYRPVFEQLGFVTCRTFETPASGTIPLLLLNRDYVVDVFGERATELMISGEEDSDKILDVLDRPHHYAEIVMEIRKDFRERHSPEARLRELIGYIRE